MVTIRLSLKMHRVRRTVIGSLLLASLLLGWIALTLLTVDTRYEVLAAQTQSQSPPAEPPLPNGPGKDVVLRECTKCHDLKVITSKRASEDDWAKTVADMVSRGADLSDDEVDKVIDYLSKNFKPAESDKKQQPDTTTSK